MRSSHSLHVPIVEIQQGESFVDLDSPPHTPRTEALLQSLQPLLDASEIENFLREQDRALEEPQTPFADRSDQTDSPHRAPPPAPTYFTGEAVVANGLSAPPPRSRRNPQRLELQESRSFAARASGGNKLERRRRPSALQTVPWSSVPSPTQSPSVLATEALSVYNFHLVEDASLVSMVNEGASGRRSVIGPDTPVDVSELSFPSSPSSNHLALSHQPSYASLSDVTRNLTNSSRLLLSRVPSSKSARDSIYSLVSSVDAPSTIHEPRISVSSTIYRDSLYDELVPSPVPTATDEFGVMRSASTPNTASNTLQAPSSPLWTQTLTVTDPHPYAQETKPTSAGSKLRTPTGVYPSARPSVTTSTSTAVHEPVSIRPIPSDGIKQFLIPKPAIPTAPKPDFRRSRSVQPDSRLSYMSCPPSPPPSSTRPVIAPTAVHPYGASSLQVRPPVPIRGSSVPPTTNMLNAQERADLIRKSRKLTQLFGQTPSPITGPGGSLSDSQVPNNMILPVLKPRRLHARGASDFQRRTSSPDREMLFSTSRLLNSKYEDDESDGGASLDSPDLVNTPLSVLRRESARNPVRSPTIISGRDSFMDLSDYGVKSLRRMSSMLSLMENMTPEEKAEEERRRKREKVAKLHRFLGSRVPTELIINAVPGTPLPPMVPVYDPSLPASDIESPIQAKLWNRRRRNSIAGTEAFDRLPEVERKKEEMTDKERALIVKRALKMERMFGEQPPQDLFRAARTVSGTSAAPTTSMPSSPLTSPLSKSSHRKKKSKTNDVAESSESERRLLDTSIDSDGARSVFEGLTEVYMHYRSSLVSLANIVDNDDRKSLAELHEYMNEETESETTSKRESYSTVSTLPERRRSLPPRASVASLFSQYDLGEPAETSSAFEQRRRRAAKLTQFFGVQYRDLFGEVLDSIENSVREDEGKGTLRAAEAQDLLVQLSKLRARKDELS